MIDLLGLFAHKKENCLMDEKDCEMLQMLEKTMNITKAAGRLYTTQSALTKRIQ